jgi:HAD superfamily hydrolase (TIGR01549 family)
MKNIRLVIFDLDGTLINAYRAIHKSLNFTMARLGYPCQVISVVRRAVGWGDKNLLRPFVDKKDLAVALGIYRKHHEKSLVKYSRAFSGVKKLLSFLKSKRYKLAVASNRPTKFSLILLDHLGLNKYFDYVLCADKLKKGKPDPQILRKIMKNFSLSRKQTLYVGDMAIDAQAGKRAAIKTVVVTTGSSRLSEIRKEKPYAVIRKVTDLYPFL